MRCARGELPGSAAAGTVIERSQAKAAFVEIVLFKLSLTLEICRPICTGFVDMIILAFRALVELSGRTTV